MLNLDKFAQGKDAIVPIVEGWGQYEGRKIYKPGLQDGWYEIHISGENSNVEVLRSASLLTRERALGNSRAEVKAYALGAEGIATNFDIFTRKNIGESVVVHFLNLPIFTVAKIVQWEDGRWYFYEEDSKYQRGIIQQIKESFESGKTLSGVRGLTPELRYYFLLASLQREAYEALKGLSKFTLSKSELSKRSDSLKQSFKFRIEHAVTQAGGKFIGYSKRGKGFTVKWKIGDQVLKTDIKDDMRVLNAGFCLSGDDEKHSLSSLIGLAQVFQEEKPLYVTRE